MLAGWRTGSVHVQSVVVESCWRPMVGDTAGDFHDVIDLPDGRIVVVIGDAVGYGPPAAAIADELHARMWRAFRGTADPAVVMAELDVVLEAIGDDKIATAVCAIIDPAQGRVRIANAGHLPVVIVQGDSVEFFDGPPDPPLGVPASRRVLEREMHRDSALFLYTDGVIERRGTSLGVSLADLAQLCPGIGGSDACASEFARRATARFGPPTDDATVVSVRTAPALDDLTASERKFEQALLRVYLDPRDRRARILQEVLAAVAQRARGLDVAVEVLDITAASAVTEDAGILAAPTIVRVLPEPVVRVIGWFNSPAELARALQFPYEAEVP